MDLLAKLLSDHGPTRSSHLAELLRVEAGASPEAARKRLSRARPPVRSFPFSLLPKRERFLYMQEDRNSERFWTAFHQALRETDSVYGAALDGLLARGGIVQLDEFPVISGAPNKQKKHVPVSLVLKRLQDAGFVRSVAYLDNRIGEVAEINPHEIGTPDIAGMKTRGLIEGVMLDGLREWARKNGIASYNAIAIRGDPHPRLVGPYMWDLTAPSYLLPLRERGASSNNPGFLVADAFSSVLTYNHVRYFKKKAIGLRETTKVGRILPLLFAQGFTPEALTFSHKAGLLLASPETLFGGHVARSLKSLANTIENAAAVVAANPDRLAELLENLSEIEGAAGNLRGVLFELIVAFLVRYEGSSIDVGRKALDPQTGKMAEIDVLLVKGHSLCTAYECKGKGPGVRVTLAEVEDWLARLPTFRAHIKAQPSLSNAEIRFALWTSGEFEPDAIVKLEREKARRTANPIDWKDGTQVRAYSQSLKETAVTNAIDQHFFRHPLSKITRTSLSATVDAATRPDPRPSTAATRNTPTASVAPSP